MYCSNCGKEIEENKKFCKYCGAKLIDDVEEQQEVVEDSEVTEETEIIGELETIEIPQENIEQDAVEEEQEEIIEENIEDEISEDMEEPEEIDYFNKYMSLGLKVVGIFVGAAALVYIIMATFGLSLDVDIPERQINVPQEENPIEKANKEIMDTKGAKSCESKDIQNILIKLMKENYYIYKYIDPSTVKKIYIANPAVDDYDSSLDQYTCSGTLVLETDYGILPKSYDVSDPLFFKLSTTKTSLDDVPVMRKLEKIKCDLTYTTQVTDGKDSVYTSFCGDDADYRHPTVFEYNPKLYLEIPGARQKMEQKKKEMEKLQQSQDQGEPILNIGQGGTQENNGANTNVQEDLF